MSDKSELISENYDRLLQDLKERIRSAQVRASLAINQELMVLYWRIGQDILTRQSQEGWGAKVIERLAKDLKREFPNMKGFSRTSLMYMRAFADAYPDIEFVQRSAGQIPWRHNQAILDKLKIAEERQWYVQQSLEGAWSRDVLILQIESGLYQRQGKAISNFDRTLPAIQSDLAQQLIKDPYHLEFLTLAPNAQERDLEFALVTHIRDFLLELGVGFAFVGSQYRLIVDREEFFVDLLFYHLKLRCYVVIDLKMTDFKPEYSGKMNFYVAAIDDLLRHVDDQPTIGIILCRDKKKTIAEYSLRNIHSPIAISTHRLPKQLQDDLPSVEQLETEINTAISELIFNDEDKAED